MEELPLCTQPLHHIHTLSTEEADIATSNVDGELFSEGALQEETELNQYKDERNANTKKGRSKDNRGKI